ncbi:hypothetical protein [Tsukamurella tyrosinosolvens]|uniref:hypothetical protein n=1 Tax=Tsukamurella tyrosinosolvens TaxID=57704 RepID=UPI00125EDDCF|nr:hypothetical protein [Tsukamurella tyrosinosolvens]
MSAKAWNWIMEHRAILVVICVITAVFLAAIVMVSLCLGWSSFYHWWTAPRLTATSGVATLSIAAFATLWFNHRVRDEGRKRSLIAINRDITTGDVAKARQAFSRAEWRWRGEHGDRSIEKPPSAQDRVHERKYPTLSVYDSAVFDSYWVLLGALERTAAELAVAPRSNTSVSELALKRSFIHILRWLHLYLYVTDGPDFEKPGDSAITKCEGALIDARVITKPDLARIRADVGTWIRKERCACPTCRSEAKGST